mmetsp:Transcript_10408/g.20981  ORF Transcript_10408/g.20981 Transcript_10408/m.20981 type:complete len:277 (-) Transcript_10408:1807-2637(-)
MVSVRRAAVVLVLAVVLAALIPPWFQNQDEERLDDKLGSGAMFDGIAATYDLLNKIISLGWDKSWRQVAVSAIRDAMSDDGEKLVLDVATGTGDVAIEVLRQFPRVQVIGLDPSQEMLRLARAKSTKGSIHWVEGQAENLSQFQDGQFDAITVAFGVRNFLNRTQGLGELRRVLKPSSTSRLVILEIAGFSSEGAGIQRLLEIVRTAFISRLVPLVGGVISGGHFKEYRYLDKSLHAFPGPGAFQLALKSSGLNPIKIQQLAPFRMGPYLIVCNPS